MAVPPMQLRSHSGLVIRDVGRRVEDIYIMAHRRSWAKVEALIIALGRPDKGEAATADAGHSLIQAVHVIIFVPLYSKDIPFKH